MSLYYLASCFSLFRTAHHVALFRSTSISIQTGKMYIDSQPASLHARAAAAAAMAAEMESPRPRLRRPPTILNLSSSSSLRGMEMADPPSPPAFQAFVKRTPPVDQDKPLPPAPRIETPSQSKFAPARKRTSSVYSRTMSQWAATPVSWRSRDFAASDMFLQSPVYSLSTPELVVDEQPKQDAIHTLLQPRAYQPLIQSPSPTPSLSYAEMATTPLTEKSAVSLNRPYAEHRASELLPLSEPTPILSSHHVKAVSLDKTRAVANGTYLFDEDSKGSVADEARTRKAIRKSRSMAGFGDLVMEKMRSRDSSMLRTTLYSEWQDYGELNSPSSNLIQPSPWIEPSVIKFKIRESKLSDKYFGVDPIDRSAMAPVVRQQLPLRKSSILEDSWQGYHKADIPPRISDSPSPWDEHGRRLSIEEDYEDRGRARVSSTLVSPQSSNLLSHERPPLIPEPTNASVISEAERLAQEYHDLLPRHTVAMQTKILQTARQISPDGHDISMAPKPLFFNPRQVSKQRSEQYNRERNNSFLSASASPSYSTPDSRSNNRWRKPSPTQGFPLKLCLTPESTRSQSTSGSIPISPPFSPSPRRLQPSPVQKTKKPSIFANIISPASISTKSPPLQRTSMDDSNRSSSFYPRVDAYGYDHIKSPRNKKDKSVRGGSPMPPVGAMVVATRAEAEAAFQTPITLTGPSITSVSQKHPSATKSSAYVNDMMASYASPLGTRGTSASGVSTTTKGHRYKSSSDSNGSSNRSVRNPLTSMGDKLASVIHRRGASGDVAKPIITVLQYDRGHDRPSNVKAGNKVPSVAAQSYLDSITPGLGSSHIPFPAPTTAQMDRTTKSHMAISAPMLLVPLMQDPRAATLTNNNPPSIMPPADHGISSLFPSSQPLLPLPLPAPNWPLSKSPLPTPPDLPSSSKPKLRSAATPSSVNHTVSRTHPSRATMAAKTKVKAGDKRPSFLSHLSDMGTLGKRESRADRRREELKRSIKLVPSTTMSSSGGGGGVGGMGEGGDGSVGRGGGGAHNWL